MFFITKEGFSFGENEDDDNDNDIYRSSCDEDDNDEKELYIIFFTNQLKPNHLQQAQHQSNLQHKNWSKQGLPNHLSEMEEEKNLQSHLKAVVEDEAKERLLRIVSKICCEAFFACKE